MAVDHPASRLRGFESLPAHHTRREATSILPSVNIAIEERIQLFGPRDWKRSVPIENLPRGLKILEK